VKSANDRRFYFVNILAAFATTACGLKMYFGRKVCHLFGVQCSVFDVRCSMFGTFVRPPKILDMRAVIQRVTKASVAIDGKIHASIEDGLLVLLGIEDADTAEDVEWLSGKIVNLRIFNDTDGIMNISIKESGGDILLISQFTLHASTKKGNRPSYIKASKPDVAVPFYEKMIQHLSVGLGKKIKAGIFGAEMKVELLNDGPVTIIIDSKNKE